MVSMTVRGEFFRRTSVAPGIELALFRNDEEDFNIFEIKMLLPQDRIFISNQHYCDARAANEEYEKILKDLILKDLKNIKKD